MAKIRKYISKPGNARTWRKRNWIQNTVKRSGEPTRKLHRNLGMKIVVATTKGVDADGTQAWKEAKKTHKNQF